ncbi:hypothetical protein JCGZ_04776 [Jatropha curcas]|uniref:S-adenosylmethionine-dependent methyltransferase n=1 Tax=Jatropha curcas TaxID=180498 RepID=A0A067KT36_JATCU|nr:loganic acid O-methyltransferase [Jatropha curcas]KDP38133.1 hypothetical protein JCGZ_04776 [Jatropha curcas]
MATTVVKSHVMNGGDGEFSYSKHSSFQKESITGAKEMISEEIAHKLDLKELLSTSTCSFNIADLGCSVGPNTFMSMQNVIEAVTTKYQTQFGSNSEIPQFQVLFNDQELNDFNTLFRTLPPKRQYFAAGVPGSFYNQLFPNSSLHFINASHAVHWLSEVPKDVLDQSSAAWNKGRIFYSSAPKEVYNAYTAQFEKDMAIFLNARAKELVSGGLLVLVILSVRIGDSPPLGHLMFELLESVLVDMAKEGIIREDLVDSYNVPIYYASPEEMAELVERNGCFKIERIEQFSPGSAKKALMDEQSMVMHYRAGMEGMLSKQFGSECMDEVFVRLSKKVKQFSSVLQSREPTQMFLALKRK